MWTRREALKLIRNLEALFGTEWHFALAGSVLYKGASKKDLDLIAFPHTTASADRSLLRDTFLQFGWYQTRTVEQMHRHWRTQGSSDEKHVEVWYDNKDRRIDLFIFDGKATPDP